MKSAPIDSAGALAADFLGRACASLRKLSCAHADLLEQRRTLLSDRRKLESV